MNEDVRPGASVLVDTNVIIEAHRTETWAALVVASKLVKRGILFSLQ